MTYLVHPKRNWRWKTLRVPARKQLLSGKHVPSPQRNPLAVYTVWMANAVCLNADSPHVSPLTQENFACILEFAFLRFILHTTVILIASFASVFNGSICLGKQDDGCMVLWVLAHLQGLVPTPGADRVVWQSSKLEAETFKLGWMAGWGHWGQRGLKLHAWTEWGEEGDLPKTCQQRGQLIKALLGYTSLMPASHVCSQCKGNANSHRCGAQKQYRFPFHWKQQQHKHPFCCCCCCTVMEGVGVL